MSTSRPLSNGRSPIMAQQRQITSFFSKSSATPPNSYILNHGPDSKMKSHSALDSSPSSSPTTPSPVQKRKKSKLVIGLSPPDSTPPSPTFKAPITSEKPYGDEVVGRKLKVYWPLDRCWYDGCVQSFDSVSGKHLVHYDDSEEEVLDLSLEKIEWIKEPIKKFRRLRRVSIEKERGGDAADKSEGSSGDDSDDDDWRNDPVDDLIDNDTESELPVMEEENGVSECSALKKREKTSSTKRKLTTNKLVSLKKMRTAGIEEKRNTVLLSENNSREIYNRSLSNGKTTLLIHGETTEKFACREAGKLWFLGDKRMDAKLRHPGDENYDPRTLYLPPDFLKSLSGGQRQWWDFKSKHMDKVLFFKMGKFYELFEMDAHVAAKELGLQYMKGEQPHCGFPEKNFSANVEKLAWKGYRVLVIEQTETPEQLELRRKQGGSKDKVVKREICAVVSKGTLTEGKILQTNPDALYLMSVTEHCSSPNEEDQIFGICVIDVATSRLILGQFNDDSECSALACLLTEIRPVEIIKPSGILSSEAERVLRRHTRSPLINDLVPLVEFWDAKQTICEVTRFYKKFNCQKLCGSPRTDLTKDSFVDKDELECLPKMLLELFRAGDNGTYALSALGGALFYLKQAFLDEATLQFGNFELLPYCGFGDIVQKPYLVLDAAALENLEIFENSRNGDSTGTLYAHLNHCVTAFGKRLLRRWLAKPLFSWKSIRERQDAIAALRGTNLSAVLEFQKQLSRLPDMERLFMRLFNSSGANGRNANKVVLYEDAERRLLQEFVAALHGCETMHEACSSLHAVLDDVESVLLDTLLTPGKSFLDVSSVLRSFKDAFDWLGANDSGRIIPNEGTDVEYDSACTSVKEVESRLSKHLKEQRSLLGDATVSYVTVGKEEYLLEVPESLRGNVPRNYELRSSRKGFFRYWNPDIKQLLEQLSQAESEKQAKLKSILQRLIGRFCEHHVTWRQLVSSVAELDAIISLAIASDYYEGPSCRPTISPLPTSDQVPHCKAKNLGHPILRCDGLGKGAFVPNDVIISGPNNARCVLLTGPNMGGKSTLLRQVCLAVVLAQLGADVPAETFEMSPVDRIFVRMGAKDHIMAGKSTFLTELSETACVLTSATHNSLVVLDELGRGTSTSDGLAIADAVLHHLLHNVQCRALFSTHYHQLSKNYRNNPTISLCHMACEVGRVEEVTFLYRLTPGACPKSYGVNVARLAGLPESLLSRAALKSEEFEASSQKVDKGVTNRSWEAMMALIQKIINASVGNTLSNLQYEARILLEQC